MIAGLLLMNQSELRSPPVIARPHTAREVVANLGEGLGYVRRTPIVLLAVVVVGLVATFGMNFNVFVPAMARDVLGAGAAGFGFLMAATGLGSLASALAIAASGRPRTTWIVGGALLTGVLLVAFAVSRSFAISLVALFGVGAGAIGMAATANTVIQTTVPDHLRGRVVSVYLTVFAGSTPIGGLLFGALASAFGIATSVAIGGALSTLVGAGGFVWLRRLAPQSIGQSPQAILEPVLEPVSSPPTSSPVPGAVAAVTSPSGPPHP